GERCSLVDEERPEIGQRRQRRGHEQEHGRIVPAVVGDVLAPRDALLRGMMRRPVVGLGRLALERQPARGIDVGEVGADGAAGAIDDAVGGRQQRDDGGGVGEQQERAVDAHARARHEAPCLYRREHAPALSLRAYPSGRAPTEALRAGRKRPAQVAAARRPPEARARRGEPRLEPAQRVVPPGAGAVGARCCVPAPPALVLLVHFHSGARFRVSLVASSVTVVAPVSVMAPASYLMSSDLYSTATSRCPMPRKPPTPITTAATLPSLSRMSSLISPMVSLAVFFTLSPISVLARICPGRLL